MADAEHNLLGNDLLPEFGRTNHCGFVGRVCTCGESITRVLSGAFGGSGAGPFAERGRRELGDSGPALISFSYWQTHFGGSSSALGKSLRVAGGVLTIVGVLPPRFHFPDKSDVWRTSDAVDRRLPRTSLSFLAIGRLKGNVTVEQAQAQLTSIAVRLAHQYPDSNKSTSVALTRMRDEMVGDVRLTLYLLLGAVGLVLVIACANVATLLLTKATTRTREIAIRAAVGAGKGRIIRQLITESLLLALAARG